MRYELSDYEWTAIKPRGQAVLAQHDLGLARQRGVADPAEHAEVDEMILAQARTPFRKEARARPRLLSMAPLGSLIDAFLARSDLGRPGALDVGECGPHGVALSTP